MDASCKACGHPLERVDDFWYCDNPDCPARARVPTEKAESGDTGSAPVRPTAQDRIEKRRS
jgi:hypothetical protein